MSGFEPCDEESEEGEVNGLCCQDPPSPAAEALRANEAVRANRLRTAIVVLSIEMCGKEEKRGRAIGKKREMRRDERWRW